MNNEKNRLRERSLKFSEREKSEREELRERVLNFPYISMYIYDYAHSFFREDF